MNAGMPELSALATLIVNPAAGGAWRLTKHLPAITKILAAGGFGTRVLHTTSAANSAAALAAGARDSALVVACGGDGTVHGVVQGLAHTSVPLGILPLGTANALARNLGLPLDPRAAVTQLLTYAPRRIPLGEMTTAKGSSFFAVMAGCGPDGALAHTLSRGTKSRFGRAAYYGEAARLFLTRRWPAFQVEYRTANSAEWQRKAAAAVLASRIPDLGGLFSSLTPLATMTSPYLHVHLLRAPAHLSLPAWFALSRTALPNPYLQTLDVEELRCTPLAGPMVRAQADGDPVGGLPMSLRMVPDALTLLMPRG